MIRNRLLVLIALGLNFLIAISPLYQAQAEIPYTSLEKIRQLTIVTRVATDYPGDGKIKSCPEAAKYQELSQKLALKVEEESIVWSNAYVLVEDLALLKKRIAACKKRGSCHVYAAFLELAVKEQASAGEVEKISSELENRLTTIDKKDYLQALASVPNPCTVLKSLKKL